MPHRLCRGIFGPFTYATSGRGPCFGGRPRPFRWGANPRSTQSVSGPPKVVTIWSMLMYLRMSDCALGRGVSSTVNDDRSGA